MANSNRTELIARGQVHDGGSVQPSDGAIESFEGYLVTQGLKLVVNCSGGAFLDYSSISMDENSGA